MTYSFWIYIYTVVINYKRKNVVNIFALYYVQITLMWYEKNLVCFIAIEANLWHMVQMTPSLRLRQYWLDVK